MVKEDSSKRLLRNNILSLFTFQGVNYLLSFLLVPYLFRTLGPTQFGIAAMAQAVMQFFILLQEHGLHLAATRDVSLARDDNKNLSQIFHSVLAIKTIIVFISFICLLMLVSLIPEFREQAPVYFFSFGLVIGNAFSLNWFFQGLEQIQLINRITVLLRIIMTVVIFIVVKTETGLLLYVIINSAGFIIIAASGLAIAYFRVGVSFVPVNFLIVKRQALAAKELFASRLCVTVYTTLSPVLLGIMTNSTMVGYYSVADKLVKVLQSLWGPVNQGLYPQTVRLLAEAKREALKYIGGVFVLILMVGTAEAVVLYYFAEIIITVLFGSAHSETVTVLRILSLYPLATAVSGILGTQLLIPLKQDKVYLKIYCLACFGCLGAVWRFVPLYQASGLAYAQVFTEVFVAACMIGIVAIRVRKLLCRLD